MGIRRFLSQLDLSPIEIEIVEELLDLRSPQRASTVANILERPRQTIQSSLTKLARKGILRQEKILDQAQDGNIKKKMEIVHYSCNLHIIKSYINARICALMNLREESHRLLASRRGRFEYNITTPLLAL